MGAYRVAGFIGSYEINTWTPPRLQTRGEPVDRSRHNHQESTRVRTNAGFPGHSPVNTDVQTSAVGHQRGEDQRTWPDGHTVAKNTVRFRRLIVASLRSIPARVEMIYVRGRNGPSVKVRRVCLSVS